MLNNNQHRSTSNDNSNSYVTVEIAGVNTDLLIDTGAQVSVLTKTALIQLSPRISIQPARNNLKHFGGGRFAVVGTSTVPVRYREQLVPSFTLYVVQYGTSILGQDLFDSLNYHIVDGNSHSIRSITPATSNTTQPSSSTIKQPILQHFGSLLQADPSKSIKGYVHKPIVNELVPPVARPLRRVPLALLPKVKEELDRMVRDSVLKQIAAAN